MGSYTVALSIISFYCSILNDFVVNGLYSTYFNAWSTHCMCSGECADVDVHVCRTILLCIYIYFEH